jgi:hypothetical protein
VAALAVLVAAGLAAEACADAPTGASPSPAPFRAEATGETVIGTWSIPISEVSLGWTNTGIVAPHDARYRLRVTGTVTVTLNPALLPTCPMARVDSSYLGTWGPVGISADGSSNGLRVRTTATPPRPEFPWTKVDATTIESVVDLKAGSSVYVARDNVGASTTCDGGATYIEQFLLTASQSITVSEMVPPPDADLTCKGAGGETPVERGAIVRCVFHSRTKPFTVLTERATGKGFTVAESPNVSQGAGTDWVWEGPAVANTHVQMQVNLGGEQKTFSADFAVKPRDWPRLKLAAPIVKHELRPPLRPYPDGHWGNFGADMNQATLNAIPVTHPATGPNAGVAFLTNPWPEVESTIYLHPAMYDDPAHPNVPWQQWHADQNGKGSGTCTQAVFAYMVPFAERHEGVTEAPNSHWGITQHLYDTNDYEQRLEEVYSQTDRDVVVRSAAYDVFVHLHDQTSVWSAQQAAFDKAEYPLFESGLGCTLDYNLNDRG